MPVQLSLTEDLLRLACAGGAPVAARERALDLLVDYLAVVQRGMQTPSAQAARAAAGSGPAAAGAIVDGTGLRLPAIEAALVNGTASHSIELDDTYEPASMHPGVCVWPAVLALADEHGYGWDEALDAAVAGYDVMCAVGDRLGGQRAYARGFHPTAVCGPFGAAVASARLLGLDEDRTRHALGIAASKAGGLLAFLDDGAWTKRLHAGQAAASGIRAAQLAQAGFTGPADALDGSHGFIHAFGGEEPLPPAVTQPGDGVCRTSVKLHPSCRYMHGCLDLLLGLELPAETVREIVAVDCSILTAGWDLVAAPRDHKLAVASSVDAQFSMYFGAALALTRGSATLEDFDDAERLAPALRPLMEKVHCVHDDALDERFPASWGAAIEIRLADGSTIEGRQDDPDGSPARPADRVRIVAKAGELVGPQRAAEIAEACARAGAGGSVADDLRSCRVAVSRVSARA